MKGCCISSSIRHPGEMSHFKMPRQCSLIDVKYPRIVNLVKCSVAKDLDHRLVISDDEEVIAALCVVAWMS